MVLTGVFSSCVILLMKLVRCEEKLMCLRRTPRAEKPRTSTMIVEMKLGNASRSTSDFVGVTSSVTFIYGRSVSEPSVGTKRYCTTVLRSSHRLALTIVGGMYS